MTDGLERRLKRIDFHGDNEAARQLRAEARRTVDNQIQSLEDIDSKAIKLLRINVLLVGLILTALSFAAQSRTVTVDSFLNVYLGTGLLSLTLSSASAALTYTTSEVDVGVDPDDIANVLEYDLTEAEFETVASKSYAAWIDFNDTTNVLNTPWITLTVLLVVVAIAYLTLGVYSAFNDGVPFVLEAGANATLSIVAWRTGITGQVVEALQESAVCPSNCELPGWTKRLLNGGSKR